MKWILVTFVQGAAAMGGLILALFCLVAPPLAIAEAKMGTVPTIIWCLVYALWIGGAVQVVVRWRYRR